MRSNASLLTFLTVSEQNEEQIIFAYFKELDEKAPPKLHWYPDKGSNGEAEFIWLDKKVKQWLVIGEDKTIQNYLNELITNLKVNISWGSSKKLFTIPAITEKTLVNNIYSIPGVESCGHGDISKEYTCESWNVDVSFLLNEENNCEFITGNKHIEGIKQIEPYGLFSERYLFDKLNKKICLACDYRGVYRSLQGDRKGIENDPLSYRGFIQADRTYKENHKVLIRDIEGQKILGEGEINVDTGKWTVKLNEAVSKGQFILYDKRKEQVVCGEKFYLIKNISIDTQIVHTTLKDIYERDISITEKDENFTMLKEPLIWDASTAPTSEQGQIELSDRITSVLRSLGKSIVFNDPYLFGDFEINEKGIQLSKSQAIFINALIISMAKSGIEEINILGNWRKTKAFTDGDQTALIEKYKAVYRIFKSTFKKSPNFKLKAFNLCFTDQPFHDRYWLSKEQNNMYHLSNSISGIYDNNELTIMPLQEPEVMKIKPKVLERLEKSTKHNLIQ